MIPTPTRSYNLTAYLGKLPLSTKSRIDTIHFGNMKFSAAILITFLAAVSTALPQGDSIDKSPSAVDRRDKKPAAAAKGFKCRINEGTGVCSGVDTCTVKGGDGKVIGVDRSNDCTAKRFPIT
ncbi:hypothetical protein PspLS_09735 [Pyricularia sp. CBS 133598]|nr:hypothetical protein PspLS_09735 [Pyricularia sp. CBS 133598]